MKILGLFLMILFFQGCASSGAQRSSASDADKAYITAQYNINHFNDGSFSDTYQNSSQLSKGVVLGGATGAAAGGLSSMGVMPGLLTGAIIGGAIGAYYDQTATLADQLQNRGIKVIELGDQTLIVVPSSSVFNSATSNIRPTAYPTLDLIAEFISNYPNTTVKISAYTSQMGSDAVNLALSQQQAACIERYLLRRNINTRILTAAGYGGSSPVTKDDGSWTNDNYRIEISFEKVPV
ncbi:MAG: OmpA family protein [Gammaproteobacteria bacterium]|nr:OmpA family protein [Gammaproteobacteria bacterium]